MYIYIYIYIYTLIIISLIVYSILYRFVCAHAYTTLTHARVGRRVQAKVRRGEARQRKVRPFSVGLG